MRSRLLALVFSIPLVAAGAAGVVLHVCQSMGGVVVGDCGCDTPEQSAHSGHGKHSGHAANETEAKLQNQPCCTVELSAAGQLTATQELAWQQVEEATFAVVALPTNTVATSREACDLGSLRERAPPGLHGPPIFIRNCSFLN